MIAKFSLLIFFCVFATALAQTTYPGAKRQEVKELFLYRDDYLVNPNQGGTCNFGNIFGLQGIVLAPNTAMYSDDETWALYHHDGKDGTPKTRGDSCGVCYNMSGPGGWDIVVSADICDGCPNYVGEGPSLNLYDRVQEHRAFRAVMGTAEGRGDIKSPTQVSYVKVSCPLNIFQGNGLGLRFLCWWFGKDSAGKTTMASCEFTVLNHRTQIVFLQADAGDNKGWQNLTRSWTNKWAAPNIVWTKTFKLRIWAVTGDPIVWIVDPTTLIDKASNLDLTAVTGNEHGFPYTGVVYSSEQFPDFAQGQTAITLPAGIPLPGHGDPLAATSSAAMTVIGGGLVLFTILGFA